MTAARSLAEAVAEADTTETGCALAPLAGGAASAVGKANRQQFVDCF
jgi:hypothetical protein